MSNDNGMFSKKAENFSGTVSSIPLSDVDTGQGSIGELFSNATEQMSSLVRAEVELAKAEITSEVKKGAIGGGLFGAAGTIALYSSFFFFFFLGELLSIWLDRWAAYLIVFLIMIALAAVLAFIGFRKVRAIKSPQETLKSVTELKALVPGKAQANLDAKTRGMFS